MKIVVSDNVSVVTDADGNIYVTRPGMHGKIQTHQIETKVYDPVMIAHWLANRSSKLIQDVFPNMSPEDREFLMTGITPTEWNAMFPKEDE